MAVLILSMELWRSEPEMERAELAAFPINKPVVSDQGMAARFLASFRRRGVGLEARLLLCLLIRGGAPSIWRGCSKLVSLFVAVCCVEIFSARPWPFLVE